MRSLRQKPAYVEDLMSFPSKFSLARCNARDVYVECVVIEIAS